MKVKVKLQFSTCGWLGSVFTFDTKPRQSQNENLLMLFLGSQSHLKYQLIHLSFLIYIASSSALTSILLKGTNYDLGMIPLLQVWLKELFKCKINLLSEWKDEAQHLLNFIMRHIVIFSKSDLNFCLNGYFGFMCTSN